MSWPLPTLADVLRARKVIAPFLRPTPVLEPLGLAEELGCRVVLKCEHLNPTGAFKVRGALNVLASLTPAERSRGVVAASTGNFAQAIAFAARCFAVPARIFMPEGANPVKVAATRALGAEVVFHGGDFDDARLGAERCALEGAWRYVHSANEPLLVTGAGTYALELLETVPEIETIVVPIGAGSGILGTGLVARSVNPAIRVVGVQAEGAPAVYRSWRERRPVETAAITTFAEGLATRLPFDLPLQWLPRFVDEIVLIDDDAIREAMRWLAASARQIVEGAGAAALAAAARLRDRLAGQTVALILSGGNVPIEQFLRILQGDRT